MLSDNTNSNSNLDTVSHLHTSDNDSDTTEIQPVLDKITLNVGGIKYETFRSTLTAYPTTLLGSLFLYDDDENPLYDAPNEFFIDRDGHLFHYIMQFYRTGKVPTIDQAIGLIPITSQELEEELEYFKIPIYPQSSYSSTTLSQSQLSLRDKIITNEIDSFTTTLTNTLLTISQQFKKEFFFKKQFRIKFEITFYHNDRISDFNIQPSINSSLKQQLYKNLENFQLLGYAILDRFGDDIGRYMTTNVQGCNWECKRVEEFSWGGVNRMYKVLVGVENNDACNDDADCSDGEVCGDNKLCLINQGEPCVGANFDPDCITLICRITGSDTFKCQLTDDRPAGGSCFNFIYKLLTSYFCLGVGLKSTIWPNLTKYAGEIIWNMNKKNHSNNKVAELIGQMANFKGSEGVFSIQYSSSYTRPRTWWQVIDDSNEYMVDLNNPIFNEDYDDLNDNIEVEDENMEENAMESLIDLMDDMNYHLSESIQILKLVDKKLYILHN
ncbi:4008_t:CDS:2 [Entrophospora sp. SA101]|nr:4008_t:CDS:2 [Entrophospora sp. SA101]